MTHQYSAENHDWDLTLRAAWSLLMTGQVVKYLPTPGTIPEKQFSCFLGSMLLSFSSIESFSVSVAFSMPRVERFKSFDFERYRRAPQFWTKIEMICEAIPHPIDKSHGLFQIIRSMQNWRNLVTHSKPYGIGKTEIEVTTESIFKLHQPFRGQEYSHQVNLDNARKFYETAGDYVKLITELTGINPRAHATYQQVP